jgi:hypothetical protein
LPVKGVRATPVDPALHTWLFVRPQIEGGRWYPVPQEIRPAPDGSWQLQVELGGAPNVRHELKAGVVDAATQAFLSQYVAQHRTDSFDQLPDGFWDEVTIGVTRGADVAPTPTSTPTSTGRSRNG